MFFKSPIQESSQVRGVLSQKKPEANGQGNNTDHAKNLPEAKEQSIAKEASVKVMPSNSPKKAESINHVATDTLATSTIKEKGSLDAPSSLLKGTKDAIELPLKDESIEMASSSIKEETLYAKILNSYDTLPVKEDKLPASSMIENPSPTKDIPNIPKHADTDPLPAHKDMPPLVIKTSEAPKKVDFEPVKVQAPIPSTPKHPSPSITGTSSVILKKALPIMGNDLVLKSVKPHVPLIKFRKGGPPPSVASLGSMEAPLTQVSSKDPSKSAVYSLEWWQTPNKFKRRQIDELECDAINSGGGDKLWQ
eukprot:TRINITY_DN389_c1_g1_i3.p1 TRINITY_DN389_c1_g1~~TRINITY_DN389_c1_g1_i3.p1  ORF type:complete len:307 (-),score=60.32 TRINITY_DN389_c1_g1_i3:238-1158(-)